jgi:hypothetical protein
MHGMLVLCGVTSYAGLCKRVADLHRNAEVVIVLSKGKLAASHMKSGGPAPDEKEFRKMLSQLESVISAIRKNEDKFGDLQFVAIHYKYVDGLFFPINDADTLIVGVMPPYDISFVGGVSALVEKERR